MLNETGWWRRNSWTVAVLLAAFSLAFLIRTLWAAQLFQTFGWLYVYGGGSDSFYHSRVMEWIILNHTNLGVDYQLRYPTGAINPREPLFDWMNAVLGILFAPFFGGDAVRAGAFFLNLQAPLWAALGVFPVYLIGRDVSSNRMGLLAALLYPLLVANIDSSVLGYANYLTFYSFVILLTVWSYVRTVRAVSARRYVSSFWRPREIPAALRAFLRAERGAVKWAVFTGVCLGTLALSWQGYPFFITILVFFLFVQLIVERIRRVDSFGLYVLTWIVGLVGFPMAMPYYAAQGLFQGWFDLPLLIFFGSLLIALPFIWLRDQPWVVSLPILAGVAGLAVASLYFVNRGSYQNIITGQGYFVKTLVYSTVAEAQAPSIDSLILGYGVVTFFLAFVGLALFVYRTVRGRFRREQTLFIVFAIVSIYLPLSAAKFFLVGSAAFALLPAEAILIALEAAGYPQLRRTVVALTDRRSQLGAFRRAFKARHALVMLLLVVIVLPNVWYAMDAGIPYNSKSQFNQQIYNTLPPGLRTSASSASGYYLGAAGVELDTPNQYDESGYNWLATQDQNLPPDQRPAFISWWDYGFQAVEQGKHPTVADNFQNGIAPAGNFLLAQNESLAIGLLATTLLQAEQHASGQPYLPAALNRILALDGVNLPELHTLLVNTSADIPLVIAHPERYLPVDPSHLDNQNAMYNAVSWFLASTQTLSGVARIYDDIQSYTGWSIRYTMVDSRLFPFSGQSTGIFYAPAELTDRVIGPGGVPTAYYNITVLGSDGNTYPLGSVPAGVTPVNYNIQRHAPFYNSMIYRVFMGYNGTDIGQSPGIPGLEGALASGYNPEPGWMLQHFQVVYRTAYYCPFPNPVAHPECPFAANLPSAVALAKATNTTPDTNASSYFNGGEAMLQYYPGLPMAGTLSLPTGQPIPGARLTVYDAWHIPHMTSVTNRNGDYSLVLPPGNDTVNVTAGPLDGLSQAGTTSLLSIPMNVSAPLALNPGAPTFVHPIVLKPARVQGFLYWNVANNTTFNPVRDPLISGATVVLWGNGHPRAQMVTDPTGSFAFGPIPPGVYNVSAIVRGANYTLPSVYAAPGAPYNETNGLNPASVRGRALLADGVPVAGANVTLTQSSTGALVASAFSGSSGDFLLSNLTTGNYTLSASLPSASLGSAPPLSVAITTGGQKLSENLTLAHVVRVSLTVVENGSPVAGIPVRFSAIPPTLPAIANSSVTPPTSDAPRALSAPDPPEDTVVTSGPGGLVQTVLPAGNYSVYGLGWANGGYVAGLESAFLPGPAPFVTLVPLFVGPASPLEGNITEPAHTNVTASSALVTVFTPHGDQASAAVNASGGWRIELPAGSYTVLAAQSPSTAKAPPLVALTTSPNPSPGPIALALAPGVRWNATIGQPNARAPHGLFPASGAQVRLSFLDSGAVLTTLADPQGNVSMLLPATTPAGGVICADVGALGFSSYSACGFTPSSLLNVTRIPLSVLPDSVAVTVTGFPAGEPIHVNFTALAAPATTVNVTANASAAGHFTVSLLPGPYRVTGWSPAPNGTRGVFTVPAALNTTVPLGFAFANFSISVLHQVASAGILVLPANVTANNVTVQLRSPVQNMSLSGSAFVAHFLIAPGVYSAFASARTATTSYANLTRVTVSSTGSFQGALVLGTGGTLTANLTVGPTNRTLNANLPVTLVGPNGAVVSATAVSGAVNATLPEGVPFAVLVNATLPQVSADGVTQFETFRNATGVTCTLTPNASHCTVPLSVTVDRTPVSGSVVSGFGGGLVQGTVTLVGPGRSNNVTSVPVVNGAFSASVVPGRYSAYLTGAPSFGPSGANASVVTVSAGASSPVNLTLGTAFFDTLSLRSSQVGSAPNASVIWSNDAGIRIVFPSEPVGTPSVYALPPGTWQVRANSTAMPYGPVANTTGNASVSLLSGNAATSVSLTPVFAPRVAVTMSPSSAFVPEGGVATFAFSVTNTGNTPLTVRFAGSPAYWNFSFSPATLTVGLGVVNRTASGEVRIVVPAGTPLAHPPVKIDAYQVGGNGSVIGTTAVSPTIALPPAVGVRLGPSLSLAVIGPSSASVPFWVRNSGNVPENLTLGIVDGLRLAGIGWNASLLYGRTPVTGPVTLAAGANQTYTVKLASPTSSPVQPGTVTVQALVTNGSMATRGWSTLPVPTVSVGVTNGTFAVTGPSLGPPPAYPDWLIPALAFVPAAAFLAAVFGLRWFRTRRWVRR